MIEVIKEIEVNENDYVVTNGIGTNGKVPFVANSKYLNSIEALFKSGGPIWVYGPEGCGKNFMVEIIARKFKRPVYRFVFTELHTIEHVLGQFRPFTDEDGKTRYSFSDSRLIQAVTYNYPNGKIVGPGAVIILDEISHASSEVIDLFYPLLDDSKQLIVDLRHGKEIVKAHPGLMVVALDNTNGYGDPTGIFVGARQVAAPFRDRFKAVIGIDYEIEVDEAILRDIYGNAPKNVVEVISKIRAFFDRNGLPYNLSYRRTRAWAALARQFKAKKNAFKLAFKPTIANFYPKDIQNGLNEIAQRHLG